MTPFQNSGAHQYPHVRYITDFCKLNFDCDVYIFDERGFEIHNKFKKHIQNLISKTFWIFLFISLKQFFQLRKMSKNYDYVITIDNFIFIYAVLSGFKKCFLWSHDFITDDHKLTKRKIYKFINKILIKCLNNQPNLIIQDSSRLKLFLETHKIKNKLNVFKLPLALPKVNLTSPIMDKFPLLMQIGGIKPGRSQSDLIINYFINKKINYRLKFHGYVDANMFNNIPNSLDIEISDNFVEPELMYEIIQKCQIGIVSYLIDDKNFYLISKASNQLVEFLRNGKPVIVLGNSDLNDFVIEEKIGIYVKSQLDFENAIVMISDNYKQYCSFAIDCYNKYFNLENYEDKLRNYLQNDVSNIEKKQ
jgi:glycosyltransferase involved in cell wall biosynthesis